MEKSIAAILVSVFLLSTAFCAELGSSVIANPNCASSSNPNRYLLGIYGQGYLENVSGLLVLHVKGSPYEMGYQNGFLLKPAIKAMINATIQNAISRGYSYEYQVNCSKAMEPHIPQEYIEEMQGLADGAGVNYTDVLLLKTHSDMMFYGKNWTGGCTGFVVFGNATIDSHLYHGKNFDGAPLPPKPCGLVTVYEPESGNAFVDVGLFGTSVGSFMNKKGISLGSSASPSSNKTLDGMPRMFVFRQVVQYSNNLAEAINIINQTHRTTGCNVLLGEGNSLNACAVETSANYCKVFWAGDSAEDIPPHYSIENAVRRANHYVDPELAATQRSPYDPNTTLWNWSWNRYEKLGETISGNYSHIDSSLSIKFLQTYPVAGGYGGSSPENHSYSWISVIFDSTDLELWVANANSTHSAHLREYIHLSYDDLFPTSVSWEVPYASTSVALNYTSSYNDNFPVDHGFYLSGTANYTFSSPDSNGVVNLTIPKGSMSNLSWYDPLSNITNEVSPISDGHGKMYTLNNTGDVDISSMTNDTGIFFWKNGAWHPPGENWIGDGTPDPAGSSWLMTTVNVRCYWGNGTNGPLVANWISQTWFTTGFSENLVIEPASRLNGYYVNATGVPYSRNGPGVVTYVDIWARLNIPYYGGPVDVQSKSVRTCVPRTAFIVTTFPSPNLYITDPINRHIGTDPTTGESINEIPEAFYPGPGSEPQRIVVPNPLDGVYDIKLIGTNTENFTLVVELATLEKTTTHTYAGNITTGQILVSKGTISEGEVTSTSPSPIVGGISLPVDRFSLLAPYVALVATVILAVSISVAIIKHRKKQ